MRVYIAYKFAGANLKLLKKNLEEICKIIETTGNQHFVFNRDIQQWGEKEINDKDIMKIDEQELNKSDIFLALVTEKEKSEGMLLELGLAKAKGMKIILAMKEGTKLFLSETIANKIIQFKHIKDLKRPLIKVLN